jgi:hypothetical protein
MSRGTYLTHRLGFNRPALSLADVSRLSQLDHIEKLLISVLIVDRERIRGLALMQCYGAPQKMAKNDSTSTSKTSLPLIERYPVIFRTIVSNALLALKHTIK